MVAGVTHAGRTLSRDRGLLQGVCAGVPIKVRLCSGGNCLISLGGVSIRVFNLPSGRSILKLGVFRGPVVGSRVQRGLVDQRPISFRVSCSFGAVRSGKFCPAVGGNAVSVFAGIYVLCSVCKSLVGCVFVGLSGASGTITCGHVRRFRRFFDLIDHFTGIKCTGFSLLAHRKCTVSR